MNEYTWGNWYGIRAHESLSLIILVHDWACGKWDTMECTYDHQEFHILLREVCLCFKDFLVIFAPSEIVNNDNYINSCPRSQKVHCHIVDPHIHVHTYMHIRRLNLQMHINMSWCIWKPKGWLWCPNNHPRQIMIFIHLGRSDLTYEKQHDSI